MRILLGTVGIAFVAVIAFVAWLALRGPSEAQSKQIAAVLQDPAPPEEPTAYSPCASCHLHDGSGRPDGSIPQLNAQRRAVLENKLHRLRLGTLHVPVMDPFARAMSAPEVSEVARYLSDLPLIETSTAALPSEERALAASVFAQHCAACHGPNGEGSDGVMASRLCGQYVGYLERRLDEFQSGARGAADAIMQGIVDTVSDEELRLVASWLAEGQGCVAP
jgi:cytochrome c553